MNHTNQDRNSDKESPQSLQIEIKLVQKPNHTITPQTLTIPPIESKKTYISNYIAKTITLLLIILIILISTVSFIYWYFITPDNKEYYSCPCCCPDTHPRKECIYHSKGDNINSILEGDKKMDCSIFGCSSPIIYSYCD